MATNYGPPDLRSHKSLADRKLLGFITHIRPLDVGILNAFIQEAEEFEDDTMREASERFMVLRTSVSGARAELIAKVAMQDEALRVTQESRVQPERPREPQAP